MRDVILTPDPRLSVSGSRTYFAYEFPAGTRVEDAVRIVNTSNTPQHLSIYAADVTTAAYGGIAIDTHLGEEPTGNGTWFQISKLDLNLEPGESDSIPFTMTLPSDLPQGEYAAAIVTQRIEAHESLRANPFDIRPVPRKAVAVLATVTGSTPLLPHFEISSLSLDCRKRQLVMVADLSNTSNESIRQAAGSLTLRKSDGTSHREIQLRLGYFLAWDSLRYRVPLKPDFIPGYYDVTFFLTHERGSARRTQRLLFDDPCTLAPLSLKKKSSPIVGRLPPATVSEHR